MDKAKKNLTEMYDRLFKAFGPQHWWPGETPFEVMVGAILTQNTNWKNVEKAIANLKAADCLSLEGMRALVPERLAELIRPAGYFNVKALRLKNFLNFLHDQYGGDIQAMRGQPLDRLREALLAVKGIGPETADSLLLYALEHPIFVIDAYTYRVFFRHFLVSEESSYDQMQSFAMEHLPTELGLFNEFHALLVRVGKEFCGPTPRCEGCPLHGLNW